MACISCRSKSLVRDDLTGNLVCESCGAVQEFDNYDAQIGGINGAVGTYVRVGTSGTGSVLNYKEKKIFNAQKLIDELTFKIGLTGTKVNEIKTLIDRITEGEFGQGDWFPILIAACSYVVMRKDNRLIPIAEISSVIGCDIHELGRMIGRVVNFLDLKLPEFDIINSFERALRTSSCLAKESREKADKMCEQGIFLLQCAVKWFLTTGRRPLPMVAAVLALVAELNEVDVSIEDFSKEVNAALVTSKLRYKELLEVLVKIAQALPWGKDVTKKNIVKNAPLVIHYMEMKSMLKPGEKRRNSKLILFDMEDVVRDCLKEDTAYQTELGSDKYDSQYFKIEDRNGLPRLEFGDICKPKISHECLSMIYTKFQNEIDYSKSIQECGNVRGRKRRRIEPSACWDWWNGKSELSKKLLLKQILEKDVGLDAMPPSFLSGRLAEERRREKIKTAWQRINKIMNPPNADLSDDGDLSLSEHIHHRKKKKGTQVKDIDWEDFIIETLLLHQVKEEEIEKGHYRTLLELYVLNSTIL